MPDPGAPLGRIERPAADQYRGQRKLLLVPLVYPPQEPPAAAADAGAAILERYWQQAQIQVNALSASLGRLRRIYHEQLTQSSEAGLSYLQMADHASYGLIHPLCEAGAGLEETVSIDLLTENLDLQFCLMTPFTNPTVAGRLQEWFQESNRNRYAYIARQIDQTLQADEAGLLLINERHQVQFPADIAVFYISPPSLDEYRRWLQNRLSRRQRAAATAAGETPEPSDAAENAAGEVAGS